MRCSVTGDLDPFNLAHHVRISSFGASARVHMMARVPGRHDASSQVPDRTARPDAEPIGRSKVRSRRFTERNGNTSKS